MRAAGLVPFLLALVSAPLLPGIINRVKALFSGRAGQPILQLYLDLWKLLHKGAVYSRTTTWIFRAAPAIALAGTLVALSMLPSGSRPALVGFPGDLLLLAGLLALGRFVMVLAALDTGSSFAGMGASREVQYAALAEPALLLALAVGACRTASLSLGGILGATGDPAPGILAPDPASFLAGAAIVIVLLAENARIPFDDPNTHLELTMVHEAMVLDYGGPDLAFVLYGAALKLWLFASLLVGMLLPIHTGLAALDWAFAWGATLAVAAAIGVIESTMARLRLLAAPQLLVGATALAAVALFLLLG